MITREQAKIGARVWYEPTPGVRFLGTIASTPYAVFNSFVSNLTLDSPLAYGAFKGRDGSGRHPSAASIERLYIEDCTCHTHDCTPSPEGGNDDCSCPETCPQRMKE